MIDRLFTVPALRQARVVCVLGNTERDEVHALAPDAHVVVVHNVVPVPATAGPSAPRQRRRPRLLFCVRLHPRNGLMTFLDVVERLGLEGHVVGPDEGAFAEAVARVQERSLPVTFHGGLDRAGVERWMTICDVLVPAPGEPFGMSMLEAFAVGLPVVASAFSALADEFAADRAALLPHDGALNEWGAAIRRVLDEPGLAESLRAGGRAALGRHLSPESLTATLTEVLTTAAETRPAPRPSPRPMGRP